ncbi:hypothetical protein DFH07DRAFT_1021616 [Mycena maculata]|uniref:Uncharacterized protein n=1 Tax=Mycena maculata TaxID=230809 RepID=A0AAD7JAD6_9AGAR|nr:hypothetical protein DFH07DRAFT_1021616 [Mycena maculata]
MSSSFSTPVDQDHSDYGSITFEKIADATEDRYSSFSSTVETSNVHRRTTSIDFFGGASFEIQDSFGPTSHGRFSFGSTDATWSAVNRAKEAHAPQPLKRSHSISSNFTDMTGDELSDEVEPWAMATENRFDFGFTSALRDSCMFTMPREYLPSDEDAEVDDEWETHLTEVDHASDTEVGDESDTEVDDCVSETTVCNVELRSRSESPVEGRQPTPSPIDPSSEVLASSWLPGAWAPSTPVRLFLSFPRRSARVSRPPRATLADREEPQTPTKRKRASTKSTDSSPCKRVAFTGKSGKPTARTPGKSMRTSPPGTAEQQTKSIKIRRVILRV